MSEPVLSLRERLCIALATLSEEPYFKRLMAVDCTTREHIDGWILVELRLMAEFPKCTIEWVEDGDFHRNVLAVAVTEDGETVGGVLKNGAVTMYEAPSGCFASWQG